MPIVLSYSPNKHSFSGPCGAGRGIDSRCRANTCARELAAVASRGSPVASRLYLPNLEFQTFNFASYHYFHDLPKLKSDHSSGQP